MNHICAEVPSLKTVYPTDDTNSRPDDSDHSIPTSPGTNAVIALLVLLIVAMSVLTT